MDETIYKRDDQGKKVAKDLKTSFKRIQFKDKDIELSKTFKIGRGKDNDIVILDDPLVSRRHALIEREGTDFYVRDKDSTNGTFLNNNPIPKGERIELKCGDVIMVGKTRLEIK